MNGVLNECLRACAHQALTGAPPPSALANLLSQHTVLLELEGRDSLALRLSRLYK